MIGGDKIWLSTGLGKNNEEEKEVSNIIQMELKESKE